MSLICSVYSLLVSTVPALFTHYSAAVNAFANLAPSCDRIQPCTDQTKSARTQPPNGSLFWRSGSRGGGVESGPQTEASQPPRRKFNRLAAPSSVK